MDATNENTTPSVRIFAQYLIEILYLIYLE
jgi:hypothetical protein